MHVVYLKADVDLWWRTFTLCVHTQEVVMHDETVYAANWVSALCVAQQKFPDSIVIPVPQTVEVL